MVLKSLSPWNFSRQVWMAKEKNHYLREVLKYVRALVWKKKKNLQFRVTHNRPCYLLWFYPPPNIHTRFLLQILTEQEISIFLWEKRSILQCGALWCTRWRGVLTVLMVSKASLSSLSGSDRNANCPSPSATQQGPTAAPRPWVWQLE